MDAAGKEVVDQTRFVGSDFLQGPHCGPLLRFDGPPCGSYLGSSDNTAVLGLGMTCEAISFPSPSTFARPASTAARTAATSPLISTVTYPPPSFSLPITSTDAALHAVSMASMTAVKPW